MNYAAYQMSKPSKKKRVATHVISDLSQAESSVISGAGFQVGGKIVDKMIEGFGKIENGAWRGAQAVEEAAPKIASSAIKAAPRVVEEGVELAL